MRSWRGPADAIRSATALTGYAPGRGRWNARSRHAERRARGIARASQLRPRAPRSLTVSRCSQGAVVGRERHAYADPENPAQRYRASLPALGRAMGGAATAGDLGVAMNSCDNSVPTLPFSLTP